MRLELYQAETARIAAAQCGLLDQARSIMAAGRPLAGLEQSGVLHALQVLIEKAIGKAKQLLKARNQPVPISGYDAFKALVSCGIIEEADIVAWNAVVGLRNRIVHDYMNIDMNQVLTLIKTAEYQFVVGFLLKEIA